MKNLLRKLPMSIKLQGIGIRDKVKETYIKVSIILFHLKKEGSQILMLQPQLMQQIKKIWAMVQKRMCRRCYV